MDLLTIPARQNDLVGVVVSSAAASPVQQRAKGTIRTAPVTPSSPAQLQSRPFTTLLLQHQQALQSQVLAKSRFN
jgi:hypothetical protein